MVPHIIRVMDDPDLVLKPMVTWGSRMTYLRSPGVARIYTYIMMYIIAYHHYIPIYGLLDTIKIHSLYILLYRYIKKPSLASVSHSMLQLV